MLSLILHTLKCIHTYQRTNNIYQKSQKLSNCGLEIMATNATKHIKCFNFPLKDRTNVKQWCNLTEQLQLLRYKVQSKTQALKQITIILNRESRLMDSEVFRHFCVWHWWYTVWKRTGLWCAGGLLDSTFWAFYLLSVVTTELKYLGAVNMKITHSLKTLHTALQTLN